MVTYISSRHPSDRSVLARITLRKYGRMMFQWVNHDERIPRLRAVLQLSFVGSFRAPYMAQMLDALMVVPPDEVKLTVRRRNVTCRGDGPSYRINGVRPALYVEWYGDRMRHLLDLIGWRTGNPRFDTQIMKYQRWLTYRNASRKLWGVRHGQKK